MRVLHLHDRGDFQGGVEQILYDTATGLAGRGHEQALLTSDARRGSRFASAFGTVASSPDDARRFAPDVVVTHKYADERTIASLQREFPSIQVVHDHDLYCPRRHKYLPLTHRLCGSRAGVACATRLCLVQRGTGPMPLALTSMKRFRSRMAVAQRSTLFVAGSRYSAGQLAGNGFDAGRIRIIPPVPAALAQADSLSPGDPCRMLFMGQIVRGKGLDLLIRAAAGLQGHWNLDVVGAGPQLEECRQLATQLGVAARINFAGWMDHSQLGPWIAAAGFVVVPSRWPEPFGMVGIEALARARAVVAFRSGGIPDWLRDGVTGLLAEPGDVGSLRTSLQRLLDDPQRAVHLGLAGRRDVARRFTHGGFLDAMESALFDAASFRGTLGQSALQIAVKERTGGA